MRLPHFDMTQRPPLTRQLTPQDFLAAYWLKSELIAFCRAHGLPAAGSKEQITTRIATWLAGVQPNPNPRPTPQSLRPRRRSTMPEHLTPQTVIGEGWRMSRALRRFFEANTPPGFHFNRALRSFLARGAGCTLEQAIEVYRLSLTAPAQEIEPQFEYNRHMRDFHARHPGASHADAVAAWWAKRGKANG